MNKLLVSMNELMSWEGLTLAAGRVGGAFFFQWQSFVDSYNEEGSTAFSIATAGGKLGSALLNFYI